MPTTDNPTNYSRSKGIMPGKYDTFFKWANQEPNEWTGNVESPVGYVTILSITHEDIDFLGSEMKEAGHAADILPKDQVGHFVTREDSNGLIWAMHYDKFVDALADFKEAEKVFSDWELAEDEEE